MSDLVWSDAEKEAAQIAFNRAYEREIAALIQEVSTQAASIAALEDLWRLHDFLSARRHDVDGKYDYRYSVLVFVFSRLVKEGWLQLDELEGLEQSKVSKIAALARM
ncbi:MAG TPA: hypothetical protein V6C46_04270 [Coleofasciculaceae cyanobacterium]